MVIQVYHTIVTLLVKGNVKSRLPIASYKSGFGLECIREKLT